MVLRPHRVIDTRTDVVHASRWPNPGYVLAETACNIPTAMSHSLLGCSDSRQVTCLDCIAKGDS